MRDDIPEQILLVACSLCIVGLFVLLLTLSRAVHQEPRIAPYTPAVPACYAECAALPSEPVERPLSAPDCALLGMARIAAHDGWRLSAGHWRVAALIGSIAETCDEAFALVAISRQESTWNSGAVSHAGACGITQVRSCDAEGTFDIPCCDTYTQGGHHCRPTCEWLLDTGNALWWTAQWLRDRQGWNPEAYVGARDPAIGAGYVGRAEEWLRIAAGGE